MCCVKIISPSLEIRSMPPCIWLTDWLRNVYNGAFCLDISPSVLISDSVCTECTSHDSLHPAMLHGVTEMLYTVSGWIGVTSNDVEPFSVQLPTILVIDPLSKTALTQYHSGSHIICDFCIETVKDVVLTVVWTVGQLGKPVKCTGTTEIDFTALLYSILTLEVALQNL